MPKLQAIKARTGVSEAHKLSVISVRLRRGDVTAIAAKTGYDLSHVSRVLRGQRSNADIVNAAYARVSKRKVKA